MSYLTILLNPAHDKKGFSCGKPALDAYLHQQAGQDVKRNLSVVFILPYEGSVIKGFYTLSNESLPIDVVPKAIAKKMPRSYKTLPTTLLGRLAVDKRFAKQGVGELLLIDALKRAYNVSKSSLGSIAVIVDPLDDDARRFYLKYGFIELPESGKMFLPMATIEKLMQT